MNQTCIEPVRPADSHGREPELHACHTELEKRGAPEAPPESFMVELEVYFTSNLMTPSPLFRMNT
jgi:hypothetical protein